MGRTPCCEKAHTNKGAWTRDEDQRLVDYIRVHGEGCWRSLPKAAGLLRCGKSCRLRWTNYLRPDLKRGNFTQQEDDLIIKLHTFLGNKWSLIAGRLPGRTDNEIKNYWNTHIKRKLISRGVDPTSHRPINELSSNCTTSSAITTEEEEEEEEEERKVVQLQPSGEGRDQELVNLELSIGLGTSTSPAESTRSISAEPSAPGQLFGSVCLCWRLAYSQKSEPCGNCLSANGPFRYFS